MILLDYNQCVIANFMGAYSVQKRDKQDLSYSRNIENILDEEGNLNEKYLKYMVLDSIRRLNKRFRNEYGKLIICTDGLNIWRKEVFPYYKANRKKTKDNSEVNWTIIHNFINSFREELQDNLPYPIIFIDRCEADDIIGTLTRQYGNTEKVLILSGDQDFCQLHINENIKQYDDIRNRFIVKPCPYLYLKEHIIRGDTGDGCPSYLSEDNVLVLGIRQRPIFQKKLDIILHQKPEEFCNKDELRRYKRNERLIDLSFTPQELQDEITNKYNSQMNKKANIFNYLIRERQSKLIEDYTDF